MVIPSIAAVTARITARSQTTRAAYMERMARARDRGPGKAHLSCSNLAHAYAGAGPDQGAMVTGSTGNIGIVTAYNDMLSAHRPLEDYPRLIREAARIAGGTAQVAGGVPAMCDGVTQGAGGMELSLFSRDVIALAAGIALSHDVFDAALYLGVCDKIVPGLVIAAATFGHLPGIFVPAGPMTSGLPNEEKAQVRKQFAAGEVGRDVLMAAEMASYHGSGTCTFYGTANTNQMLMEVMGLHLPGSAFVPPDTDLRAALVAEAARRVLGLTVRAEYTPVCDILDERAFVNGIAGLMATGGSTNLVLHLPAMARAAGVILDLQDFADISAAVPLIARVYPNGLADVNHFHAAGGIGYVIAELLAAGLLHDDVRTVAGPGLEHYTQGPVLRDGAVQYDIGTRISLNDRILRTVAAPFSPTGGLVQLHGDLGRAVIKTSAIAPERQIITAAARVFDTQDAVKAAFKAGEFTSDVIVVVRFQGPRANGMPELHALTPTLAVLQDRGLQVALVTDGRMSGASGKVPAAIHLAPEAALGGPLARIRDGDIIRLDAIAGRLDVLTEGWLVRELAPYDAPPSEGVGRELFALFRATAGMADSGAGVVI
jgi:phosphogluconate dehydratase